jgi:ribosomal protein S12 methylthiotransferase
MKISLLSLGCLKNQADSESLLRALKAMGFTYTSDPGEADVMLVNTCGFIEEAKRESIEEILTLARLRDGRRRLLVFGCLTERYRDELQREMPEIDALFGVSEHEGIKGYLGEVAASFPPSSPDAGRVIHHVAPLKAAEGCSRRCTYCAIPSIRGPLRSRGHGEVLGEARALLEAGVRELVLVAQDLTGFGRTGARGSASPLARLLRDLASIEGDFRIRPMYFYPTAISGEILEVMAGEGKICNYIDMPLQHSEDRILRLMRRQGGRRRYLGLLRRIRRAVPDVALRTTIMVGFPGEGKEEFRGLMEFIEEAEFDRLGVFAYSREEGTPAASMKGQVPARVKEGRLDDVMRLQADISLRKNRALVGRRMRALVDEIKGDTALGRVYSQAPEVDGHTIIKGIRGRGLRPGRFLDIRITRAYDYDLEGECC